MTIVKLKTYMYMYGWVPPSAAHETITILLMSYTPIQNTKKEKKKDRLNIFFEIKDWRWLNILIFS